MNWRATLVLVLLAAGLLALVLLVEAPGGQPRIMNVTPHPTMLPALVALDSLDVQRITLSRLADGAKVVVARDEAGAWQVVEPVSGPADATAMGALLGAVSNLTPTRRFEAGIMEPQAVGLDPATVVVEIALADGGSVRVLLGDDNPQGSACYAQVDGDDAVYLINRGLMMQATDMFDAPPLQPTATPPATETPAG
jgi:hypothetical protein